MLINIDTELHPWMLNIPNDKLNEYINNYLKLGYLTSTLCYTSIDPDNDLLKHINNQINSSLKSMENNNVNKMNIIETKINENLERVKYTIDKLTEYNNKSILKGNIGENFVESIIKMNFPDYTLLNMSGVPEASDYHLILPSTDIFMIEVKNYTNVVPTKEIDKFKRDMLKHGAKIGIFISLNSGITGKKRFHIETLNNKQKILYIPNSGLDGSSIIWGIIFGMELINSELDVLSINQEKIIDIYENFKFIYNKFCKTKTLIKESKDIIEQQLNKLMQEIMQLDIEIYETFKNVSSIINNELHFMNSLLINVEYNKCELIIENMLKNDDKRVVLFKEILDFCKENNLIIKCPIDNNIQWIIFNKDKEFIKFKITKTKIDLLLDDGNVVISGNDKGIKYIKNNLIS